MRIKNYSYKIIGPEIGEMACGEYGEGKMTEPVDIVNRINDYLFAINKNSQLDVVENGASATIGFELSNLDFNENITSRELIKEIQNLNRDINID